MPHDAPLIDCRNSTGPRNSGFGSTTKALGWFSKKIRFGRAPFFFFVLQLYLAHIFVVAVAFGGPLADMLGPFWDYKEATGFGFALPWVYMAWLADLGLLYAACRWYAGAQTRGHPRWLVWL